MTDKEFREEMIDHCRKFLAVCGYIVDNLWHRDDIIQRSIDLEIKLEDSDIDVIIEAINRNHDCTYGINWDTIDNAIYDHYHKQEENED